MAAVPLISMCRVRGGKVCRGIKTRCRSWLWELLPGPFLVSWLSTASLGLCSQSILCSVTHTEFSSLTRSSLPPQGRILRTLEQTLGMQFEVKSIEQDKGSKEKKRGRSHGWPAPPSFVPGAQALGVSWEEA